MEKARGILIIVICAALAVLYLIWPFAVLDYIVNVPIAKINIHDRDLQAVAKMECFEGLKPNMTRVQVANILGQPQRMEGNNWFYERPLG